MSGDQKSHEARPRDTRQPHHAAGKPESQEHPQPRGRNRRSGDGARKGVYRFEDNLEHDMCQRVTHIAPKGFPATNRAELATMPPVEVARLGDRILFCDRLHQGPHLWPNGDEVP